MQLRRSVGAGLVAALALLAACGAPQASAPTSAPPAVPTTRATTGASAPATNAPAAVRPTAPQSAATQLAAAQVAAAPTASGAADALVAGLNLPQSRTPEGYHVLGNPQAPVTITFYSDFL